MPHSKVILNGFILLFAEKRKYSFSSLIIENKMHTAHIAKMQTYYIYHIKVLELLRARELEIHGDHEARHKDHHERQPRSHESPYAHVLAAEEHPESQPNHAPTIVLVVAHLMQGQSNVRMAIVAKEIVHPGAVHNGCLGHAFVPR